MYGGSDCFKAAAAAVTAVWFRRAHRAGTRDNREQNISMEREGFVVCPRQTERNCGAEGEGLHGGGGGVSGNNSLKNVALNLTTVTSVIVVFTPRNVDVF